MPMLAKTSSVMQDNGMSDIFGELKNDITERIEVPVMGNARLECSLFCLTECGLYAEAKEVAVIASVITTGKLTTANFDEDAPHIKIDEESELPQFVMSCKGPRKKYWLAGELVCRESAKVDTV